MVIHHARRNLKLDTGIRKAIHMLITKKAVAAVGEYVGATANDTDSAISVPQHPAKIPWAEIFLADTYQVHSALNYCDNKVTKLLLKSNDPSKNMKSLKGSVHEQKSTMKDLTHQMHVDAKNNCIASLQAEDAHQAAFADFSEEFTSEIEEAYAVANTETEQELEAES